MTETAEDLGLRNLHSGGFDLALPANALSEVPFRAETAERMADSFTVIDAPFLGDTGIVPVEVVEKFTWQLSWPSVNAADKGRLIFERMQARRGFIDFCPWQRIVERFTGDGSSLLFRMMRRLADVTLSVVPPGPSWGPIVEVNDSVIASGVSYGSPDSVGRVLATFSGTSPATAPAAAAKIDIIYTPVFLVRVVSPQRTFSIPFAESRTLTFEEI